MLVGGLALGVADDLPVDSIRSLDGQVQEIKSDALSIASELNTLEERLLFPVDRRYKRPIRLRS